MITDFTPSTPNKKKITTIGIKNATSFWYPVMLAQESGEITEAKAADLLGLTIPDYRTRKHEAIHAVVSLIQALPQPFYGIVETIMHDPEFFNELGKS